MRKKLLNGIFRVIYSSILSLVTLFTGAQAESSVVSIRGQSDYCLATTSEKTMVKRPTPVLKIISNNSLDVDEILKIKVKSTVIDGLGGAFRYAVIGGSGSATVATDTGFLTAIHAGTITLTVTSSGDSEYDSATTCQQITINPAVPGLKIISGSTLAVDGTMMATVQTTVSHGRGGAIAFSISTDDGYAKVDSRTGLITGITAGAVTLTATSAGDSDYYPATASQRIMIKRAVPILKIISGNVLDVDDSRRVNVTSTATQGLGGAFRYAVIGGSGSATVDTDTGFLTAISAGTVILTATSVGDSDYHSATMSQQITINPATPVLTTTSSARLAVDGTMTATVKTTATGGRGGAITFAITTEDGYAEVNSHTGVITGITVGAVTLIATSAGDSDYYPAVTSQQIRITPNTPTLKINSAHVLNVDDMLRVNVTSTATQGLGGAFHCAVTNGTGSAVVDPNRGLLKAISAGTVTLTVTSAGDSDYNIGTASQQITILPATPVLMITSSTRLAVDGTMTATVRTTATGGRGGALTFAISTDDGYAKVDSHTGLITGITVGAVTLTVTSAGDGDYNSATESQRIMITRTTPILKIVSGNILDVDDSRRVNVTSTATQGLGGAFRYAVMGGSGSATVDPDTGFLTAIHAGTVTLTATSAGDIDYYSTTISQKLTIRPRTPLLTITSGNTLQVHGTLAVTATTNARTSQGGAIMFIVSNGSGYAVLDPDTKLLVGVRPGTVMLMAISKGDTDYNMAVASQLVTINDAMLAKIESTSSISEPVFVDQRVLVPQALSPNGDGFNDDFIIQNIENYPENEVVITDRRGEVVFKAHNYNNNAVVFTGKSSISGAELPEGVYYYNVMFYHRGESNRYVGYFKLRK